MSASDAVGGAGSVQPMDPGTTAAIGDVVVLLLVAVVGVGILSRRVRLPSSIALVLFGLLVTVVAPRLDVILSPDIVLLVLVPGLIFDAAFRIDGRSLARELPTLAILTLPGVILGALLTALLLGRVAGLDERTAFLIGVMLAPTDPVSVISVLRRLGAPERLTLLVEGESLLNDGTGIALFAVAIAGIPILPDGVASLAVTVVGSVAIGGVSGVAAAFVAGRLEDVNLETTITVIAAYGTYLVADALHVSGIIATVVAGIAIGTAGRSGLLSPRARVAVDTIWGYLAFLLSALTFLLIGLTMTVGDLIAASGTILAAFGALLLSRAVVVHGLLGGLAHVAPAAWRLRLPHRWPVVLSWAGLRGAIAVALALSLPADLANRELAQTVVFGTVLLTLVIQGGSAARVIRWATEPASTDSPGP